MSLTEGLERCTGFRYYTDISQKEAFMKAVKILIMIAVIAVIILSGYRLVVRKTGNLENEGDTRPLTIRTPSSLYSYKLADINGEVFDLKGLAGRKVILNFFATWCPPCRSEIPEFIAYRSRLGQEDNIVLIAVDVNETADDVRKFMSDDRFRINYAVLFDPSGALADKYKVKAIPTTVFISEKGEAVGRVTGAIDDLSGAAGRYFK